jgi:uncharacterized protein YjdB
MNFKHKLSKRLALMKGVMAALALFAGACQDSPTGVTSAGDFDPNAALSTTSTFLGDRVQTTAIAYIRAEPKLNSELLGTQPKGARGYIVGGPVRDSTGDGLVRWLVDFDTGVDGWAAGNYLKKIASGTVATVTVTPSADTIVAGATTQLTATLRDSGGRLVSGKTITWASSNASVATVSTSGLVTGVAPGATTITATADGKSGSAGVLVNSARFAIGDLITPTDTAYIRSEPRVSATLVGKQPPGSVGTVVGGPVVDTQGDGLTRWQIDFDTGADGWGAEPYLTDAPAAPAVASVVLTPSSASVIVGQTVQLSAVAKDASGNTISDASMSWQSLDTLIATVSATGLVRGVAAGAVLVVASSGGQADSAAVTVTEENPVRVGWYVSPSGTSGGDGSIDRPWDLATALGGAGGRVQPGDTIWMRGGTYRGAFSSTVSGTALQPVVVRQYPGERAIIDGAGTSSSVSVFAVRGQYSVFWGFEITNSDPVRTTSSTSNNFRPNVVSNYASNTKYINLVVHDGGVAFYNETNYSNVEIIGCIIYNNGWQGPDRGHGHALYLKSTTGPVVARDNVLFNQYGYGVHIYTNSGSGKLNNIRLEGNVSFNNGTLSNNSTSENILLGGADYATDDVLDGNMTYFTPGYGGRNVRIGYSTLENGSVVVQNNLIVGGSTPLEFGYWASATVSGNTIYGTGTLLRQNEVSTTGHVWSLNTHRRDPAASAWWYNGSSRTFSGWQSATGLGATDQALSGTPGAPQVLVRPSLYEPGRALVVVYNWTKQGSVSVDLTGVLNVGDRYEVRNVQSLFGSAVATGTFGGAISLPMTGVAPPVPVGLSSSPAPRTGPDFDVFLITRI